MMGKKTSEPELQLTTETSEEESSLFAFICFIVGIILIFLVVGVVATLIVMGNRGEDKKIPSLTSTHHLKPLSSGVTEALQDPAVMLSRVSDHTDLSDKRVDLLILVRSLPDSVASRNAIRQTWMKNVPPAVAVVFVVPAKGLSPDKLNKLELEGSTHKDIVEFLDCLTMPESEMLLLELAWAGRTKHFSYLMKTRDMMYIRLQPLIETVVKPLLKVKSNTYLGYFQGNANPRKYKTTKMHPEPHWYLCDNFIRFAYSGGYILSEKLVQRLYTQAPFLFPYNNEDVALGTWLAPYDDIDWVHEVRFDTNVAAGGSRGCRNSYLVFPSVDMFMQHKRLLSDGGGVCLVEYEDVETYEYNFNVFPSNCCTAVKFG